MACIRCKKPSFAHIKTTGDLCIGCFCELIERRVRKELRVKGIIRKDDRILFIDDSSIGYKVSDYLLRRIVKDLPVTFFSAKLSFDRGSLQGFIKGKRLKDLMKKHKITRVILPWSLEDECSQFLEDIFADKPLSCIGQDKLFVKMLLNIRSEEIELYAKAKKLGKVIKRRVQSKESSKKQSKQSSVRQMLDYLESRYPETKFSLLQSIDKLKDVVK